MAKQWKSGSRLSGFKSWPLTHWLCDARESVDLISIQFLICQVEITIIACNVKNGNKVQGVACAIYSANMKFLPLFPISIN